MRFKKILEYPSVLLKLRIFLVISKKIFTQATKIRNSFVGHKSLLYDNNDDLFTEEHRVRYTTNKTLFEYSVKFQCWMLMSREKIVHFRTQGKMVEVIITRYPLRTFLSLYMNKNKKCMDIEHEHIERLPQNIQVEDDESCSSMRFVVRLHFN